MVMLEKIRTYLYRRRKHSYTEMWEMLYGDGSEGSKGLIREYRFTREIAHMWKVEYDRCKEGSYNNTKPE